MIRVGHLSSRQVVSDPVRNEPNRRQSRACLVWADRVADVTNSVKRVILAPSNAYGRRMNVSRLTTPQRISAISILVVALAAFLPWISIFGISALGVEGDGVLTLLLALAGGVVLGLTSGLFGHEKEPGKKSQITLLLLAVVVVLIGLMDMNGAAAIGLYLTLFGGAAWVVGAAWQFSVAKQNAVQPGESAA